MSKPQWRSNTREDYFPSMTVLYEEIIGCIGQGSYSGFHSFSISTSLNIWDELELNQVQKFHKVFNTLHETCVNIIYHISMHKDASTQVWMHSTCEQNQDVVCVKRAGQTPTFWASACQDIRYAKLLLSTKFNQCYFCHVYE